MFRTSRRRSEACATAPVTGEVLRLFAALLHDDLPDPATEPILEQLNALIGALTTSPGCQATGRLRESISSTCGTVVSALERRRNERQQETAAFVSSVRDSIESLTVQEEAANASIGEALNRLELCVQLEDIAELKRRIAAESRAVRQVITDLEHGHTAVSRTLTRRLALTEEQLNLAGDDALVDSLTRLANAKGFQQALERRVQDADPATPLVIAFFDAGAGARDAVLRHVAATVRAAVRPHDTVARVSKSSIGVIASGLTLPRAKGRLRQIVETIAEDGLGAVGEPVPVNCGAVELSAGDSIASLLRRLDLAVGEAKALGQKNVVTRPAPSIRSLLHQDRYGQTA